MKEITEQTQIHDRIHEIRGRRVIIDADLAGIYGVATKRLNEQVKRNQDRFPDDFGFALNPREASLIQIKQGLDGGQHAGIKGLVYDRSHFATGSAQRRSRLYLPFAFTEYGALMVATVLKSKKRSK
ncbi:MAG: ORF6N domain-containing protein [Verrucomicrobia bacterium]|nr:ORF6N domain-containing protein [Verrucomicrobiota bacterium]